MKDIVKKSFRTLAFVPAFALAVSLGSLSLGPVAHAADTCDTSAGADISAAAGCAQGKGQQSDLGASFKLITNVLLFIIGAVSVIMLIIGGIRYTVSGGDSGAVTGAKNTILYAIVGIVVALLAYAVVNFVLGQFIDTSSN